MTKEHQARSERGISIVDIMVTMSVMAIVGSMATVQIGTVRRSMQGDSAMRMVLAQLNTAREMAITQRRNMEIQFVGNNSLRIVRHDVPTGTTVLANVVLEGYVQYSLVRGLTDTPDAFGNSSAISFGSAQTIMFTSDGTLIDSNGFPINGTVFLSIGSMPESARAVTVLGSTGRVRGYRWHATAWSGV
jgi:Tfp pilus assembly protein FimT